jgi:phage host-nuclease inhibitor protein Gam
MNPLQQYELEDIQEEQERQRFKITDLNSLNWAFRKLAAIEAKKADVNQLADAEVQRIESYREQELKGLVNSEDFFKSHIAEYANVQREVDPNFKAKTPYGSVTFRKQQPKWNYDDEALLTFLEQNDYADLVRVKKEPVKTDIKKRFIATQDGRVFDENGQEVTGIKVEFLPESISIKAEV